MFISWEEVERGYINSMPILIWELSIIWRRTDSPWRGRIVYIKRHKPYHNKHSWSRKIEKFNNSFKDVWCGWHIFFNVFFCLCFCMWLCGCVFMYFMYAIVCRVICMEIIVCTFEICRARHVTKIENTPVPKLSQLWTFDSSCEVVNT